MTSVYFKALLLSVLISQILCLSLPNPNEPFARFKRQWEIQDGDDENVQVDDTASDTDGSDFNGAVEEIDEPDNQGFMEQQETNDNEDQFGGVQQNQGFINQQNQGFSDQQNQGFSDQQNQGFSDQQNQGFSEQQNQGFVDQQGQFGGVQQNQQGQFGQGQLPQNMQNAQQTMQNHGGQPRPNQRPRGPAARFTPSSSPPTPRPTGTTTPRPQFARCLQNCPVLPQYNPVCGTNSVTYSNEGRLNCARNCGTNVQVASVGSCSG